MRTSSVDCRSVWLAAMTCCPAGSASGSRRGPVSRWWVASSSSTSPATRTRESTEHDQVVADPLEVGDQVRGQHDADAVLGDDLHQALQELAPGQRVEAGHRLVEDQQLRPLGHGQGQRELGALAAGQLAGPLRRVEAELRRSGASASSRVPAGVEPRAQPQVVGDRQPGVGRGVLGDEPDPGQLRPGRGAGGRRGPRSCPQVGASRPTARLSRVVLPAPFGPTRPTTRARPGCSACSRSAPTGAGTACPGPRPRRTAVTLCPARRGPKGVPEQRLDALVVQPGPARLGQPADQVPAQRPVRGQRAVASASAVTNVPTPGPGRDQPVVLQLPVRLEHRVRVDRQLGRPRP